MIDLPELAHLVGADWRGDTSESIDVFDPSTGRRIASQPVATEITVDGAVVAARSALPLWAALTPAERSRYLLEFAALLESELETIVRLESLDCGKPLENARNEATFAIDLIRFCAGAARNLDGKASMEYVRNKTSIVRREPIGVVAGITPWNYPIVMLAYKLGPALAGGNTFIVKPAEQTPLTTTHVAACALRVLPPGVVNLVLGDGPTTGAALVRHPDVALVSLTGETETGKAVAREAASTLKRVVLELGGKSPVVVFDDADLDLVAEGVGHGAFYNSGQDCTAASRVIAHESVYDEVVQRLTGVASSTTVGRPDDDAHIGPVISEPQQTRIKGFVDRATDRGASVSVAGTLPDDGYFVSPTVVWNVLPDDEIVQSEVFGPVVSVQRFSDEQHAISLANSTAYGLGASVWTRNVGRAMHVSTQIAAGAVWVNCHDVVTPEMPHGGVGASGYGKDLSMYSVEEMTHVKHIMISHHR